VAGFDDLVYAALPYLNTEEIDGTAGTTWLCPYYPYDDNKAPVDLSTGFTCTMKLYNAAGTEIIAGTASFPASDHVLFTFAASATLAVPPGKYFHEVTVTRTSDSKKIIVVGARKSEFTVLQLMAEVA
jgi:hypothetical protein